MWTYQTNTANRKLGGVGNERFDIHESSARHVRALSPVWYHNRHTYMYLRTALHSIDPPQSVVSEHSRTIA